jgi:hypothetical protein
MCTVKDKSEISGDDPNHHVKKVRNSRVGYFWVKGLHLLFDIYFVSLYVYVMLLLTC